MSQQQTSKEDKRLFLLDAYALIYRSYFAFSRRPLINSKGFNVSAIAGFVSTLNELLTREKPTHIAVVFDAPGKTEREEEYEAYKANRQEMPEDIARSVPIIKEIVKAFHIPILEKQGLEADDLIGTLAKKAARDGYEVYMVTPDKDFGQLVDDHIYIYKPARQGTGFELLKKEDVLKKWGIKDPKQLIDILGLMGDSVDNIPGVPGIGEKTAQKLIAEYGSIEAVIQNADKIKGKIGENLQQYKDQALLSKKLATIVTDADIDVDEEKLVLSEPDKEKLAEIFAELEFRTLGKRILGEDFNIVEAASGSQLNLFDSDNTSMPSPEPAAKGYSIETTPHQYHLVDSPGKLEKLIEKLRQQESVCFDTETTSLDPNNCSIVGISFSFKPFEAYYVPLNPASEQETRKTLDRFKEILENEKTEKIGQNIKFDLVVLRWYGYDIPGPFFDTMVAHYVLRPEMRHSLDVLAESYLHYKPVPIEELIGKKGKNQGNMRDVPLEKIKDYAAEDADVTLRLSEVFKPMLKEYNVDKVYHDIEAPLIKVLADMEYEGVGIDRQFLENYSKVLGEELEKIKKSIFEIAGIEFNLDSPRQLGDVLFKRLKIPYEGKKTKTGQYSTSEEVLSKLADDYKIVGMILDYRELTKLKSTYVDALPTMINPRTGRIHTSFNQTVAATGRLSSQNPNLQNIPVRTERGREIRKAFIPRDENHILISADYSQVELRIIASLSGDEALIEAFRQNHDIHTSTAARVFKVPMEEVTPEMRRHAKTVNFGIIYGISAYGLSQRLNIPRKEAAKLIENYFKEYPKVKEYINRMIEFARKHGYVETIMGRRRYLPDINSRNATVRGFAERNAINAPIQGSAADLIKLAMINIHREMKNHGMKSAMILQVHDELVFDAWKQEEEKLTRLVKDKMENAIRLKVPLKVDIGRGDNWLEAH